MSSAVRIRKSPCVSSFFSSLHMLMFFFVYSNRFSETNRRLSKMNVQLTRNKTRVSKGTLKEASKLESRQLSFPITPYQQSFNRKRSCQPLHRISVDWLLQLAVGQLHPGLAGLTVILPLERMTKQQSVPSFETRLQRSNRGSTIGYHEKSEATSAEAASVWTVMYF